MAQNQSPIAQIGNEVRNQLQDLTIYSNGEVLLSDTAIPILNRCINLLERVLKAYNALPDFFKGPIPTIPTKNDGLEVTTKLSYVVELANRIAKLDGNIYYKLFYSIKNDGIRTLSRLNIQEITHKGSLRDVDRNRSTYSLQIGEKSGDTNEYAVISWHLSNTLPAGNEYLINPNHPHWVQYQGVPVTTYNPQDKGLRQFNIQDRFNEQGFNVLGNMLQERRKEKLQERIDIIRDNIKKIVGEKNFGELEYCLRGKDIQEQYNNAYVLYKILKSRSFDKGMEFDGLMDEVAIKVDALNEFQAKFGSKGEDIRLVGYDLLSALEKTGIENFENGVIILENIKDILGPSASIKIIKSFVQKLSEIFDISKFSSHGIAGEDVIGMALEVLRSTIGNKKINLLDFRDNDKVTALLSSIEQAVKTRIEEIDKEDVQDTISIDELLTFLNEKQCDDRQILDTYNLLAGYVQERDTARIQQSPNREVLERATQGLSSKGILDLRKRMREGGYIGGGRY